MLKSIHLQGFKGFKDTKIDPIRKVNLILGGQNVGKTSLLEAVYVGGADIDGLTFVGSIFRRAEGGDISRFNKNIFNKEYRISLWNEFGDSVHTSPPRPPYTTSPKFIGMGGGSLDGRPINRYFSSARADLQFEDGFRQSFLNPLPVSINLLDQATFVKLFDRMVISRKKREVIKMLKSIDNRLEDMHSLSPDGDLRIYVELEGEQEALPLPQLGHGFNRLVGLYCSLLETNAKLALIDEVENGIHYASLPTVFKGIQEIAANNGVQTLITTHSWEAIRAAYNVFAEADALDDFQLIRLERDDDNIRAVVINDEQLVTAMESGYEIR